MRTLNASNPPLSPSAVAAYAPSWVDRLQTAIERSGVPAWTFYLILWLVPAVGASLVLWSSGAYAWGSFSVFHGGLWASAVFALALIHYLDRSAVESLRVFRPALSVCDEEVAGLEFRLTHLPATKTLAVAGLGALVGIAEIATLPADVVVGLNLFSSPPARWIETGMYMLGWVFFGTLVFHTVHQLNVVRHIYAHCTKVNPFRLDPIYSFSWLTARTALGIALLPYGYFLLATTLYPRPVETHYIGVVVASFVVATIVFVWPLWGVHRILAHEKIHLLRESAMRFEAAIAHLHACADAREYSQMDGLNKLMSSLALEQAAIEKISTWPWRPETPRLLTTALLLPLLAFLAQRGVASVLGLL